MPRFEMERIVFDTMEFLEDGAIAVALLWRTDIDRDGADMDDLDSIASLTRQIEGVQIGITMTEKADGTVRCPCARPGRWTPQRSAKSAAAAATSARPARAWTAEWRRRRPPC